MLKSTAVFIRRCLAAAFLLLCIVPAAHAAGLPVVGPAEVQALLTRLHRPVMLVYWASWCGPCRAEMPNVKEIYAKHHGDGLEILGVSLDEDADKWQKSIEDLDIPWHHVSALKGWDCPVAAYFKVTGVPAMFIIDPDGVIVAQNLRGQELADFIDDLYK